MNAKTTNRGQFEKGQSGNPKGRPRKAPPPRQSAFDVIVDKTLTVMRDGEPRQVTTQEGLQHRTLQDALAGKRLAEKQVLKWITKREAWYDKHQTPRRFQPIEMKTSPCPDNAREALELLGIVTRDERFDEADPYCPRHLLEPWAVQAALDRRRGSAPLESRDIVDILRSTRAADELRWPKRSGEK